MCLLAREKNEMMRVCEHAHTAMVSRRPGALRKPLTYRMLSPKHTIILATPYSNYNSNLVFYTFVFNDLLRYSFESIICKLDGLGDVNDYYLKSLLFLCT